VVRRSVFPPFRNRDLRSMLTDRRGKSGPARICVGTVVRALAVGAAGVLLASCSGGSQTTREHFSSKEYGVPGSPRVVAYGQKVPKGGGRYIVGKPYRVAGKTYVPRDNPNYSAVGLASWYGRTFHGRKTANGEVYDMDGLSGAHPTLPLPSYARVTNLKNGRSIVVRVNDRGPYKRGRVIDVSETVAEILDFKRAGTARVKVDYVGLAQLDGRDHKMLLATYRVPGSSPPSTMMASKAPAAKPRVVLASAPIRRAKLTPQAELAVADEPFDITPAVYDDDPLGPLILRTGFASSYAGSSGPTPAQAAAAGLAVAGDRAAFTYSALKRARQFASGAPALSTNSFVSR
jgi:rare lipoprotein A